MRWTRQVFAAAGVAAAVAVSMTVTACDPVNPSLTTIAGVGSDTTQEVMGNIAAAYNGENKSKFPGFIGSYDAFPAPNKPANIVTKNGCPSIARPQGSGAGITALLNDTTGCIDFARSSRGKKTDGTEDGLVLFAYGRDGLTVATFGTTNAPTNLTTSQLNDIYTCAVTNWHDIDATKPSATIHPFLPQAGSGTRSFFLTAIGVSAPGSCVDDSVE